MNLLTKLKLFLYKILAFLWVVALVYLLIVVNQGKFEQQLIVLMILLFSFSGFWYFSKPEEYRKIPDAFLNQLEDNKQAILGNGWEYENCLIDKDTIITQFYFTCSFIIASTKTPSRFYVVGQENTVIANFIYSFFSVVLGWWSIPHGPIYTLQTLYVNLKGGHRIRVGDIIGP